MVALLGGGGNLGSLLERFKVIKGERLLELWDRKSFSFSLASCFYQGEKFDLPLVTCPSTIGHK